MDSVFDNQIQDIINLKTSATALFKACKFEDAIITFEKTLAEVAKSDHLKNQDRELPELAEIDAICILYIARSLMHLKKYSEAIIRLKQVLEIDSDNAYALYKLGTYHRRTQYCYLLLLLFVFNTNLLLCTMLYKQVNVTLFLATMLTPNATFNRHLRTWLVKTALSRKHPCTDMPLKCLRTLK